MPIINRQQVAFGLLLGMAVLTIAAYANNSGVNTQFNDGIFNPRTARSPPTVCTVVAANFTTGCVVPMVGGM